MGLGGKRRGKRGTRGEGRGGERRSRGKRREGGERREGKEQGGRWQRERRERRGKGGRGWGRKRGCRWHASAQPWPSQAAVSSLTHSLTPARSLSLTASQPWAICSDALGGKALLISCPFPSPSLLWLPLQLLSPVSLSPLCDDALEARLCSVPGTQ